MERDRGGLYKLQRGLGFFLQKMGTRSWAWKRPCRRKGGRGPGPGQPHLGANRWNKGQPTPGALAPGPRGIIKAPSPC